jgi:hypothetical protein
MPVRRCVRAAFRSGEAKDGCRRNEPGAVKSPSPVKADPKAEAAASVAPPAHDPVAANKVEPAVEAVSKQRRAGTQQSEPAAFVAPEKLKVEKPIGPAARRRSQKSLRWMTRTARRVSSARRNPTTCKLISGVGPKIEGIVAFARHLHLRAGRRLEDRRSATGSTAI